MGKRASGALLALAVLTMACDDAGDDTPAGAGASQGGETTATAPLDTLPLVTETTAGGDDSLDEAAAQALDDPCVDVEQRTLETAVEAFYAENQRFPTDTLELFTEGFLRVEYTGFEIEADGAVVREPATPCLELGPDDVQPDVAVDEPSGFPMTADDWLEILGDDIIAGVGGIECATEIAIILVAAIEYSGFDGPDPESMAELEPYLERPIELWTLEPGDGEPQPVPGSGCSTAGFDEEPAGQFPDPPDPENTFENQCAVERRTFETAVEAFMAVEGDERPPTEDELVGSYLREPFDNWDLDGWDVVLAPGSPCPEPQPDPIDEEARAIAQRCMADIDAIIAAMSDYYGVVGAFPTDQGALVEGGYLAQIFDDYVFEDNAIVPSPDSPCENTVDFGDPPPSP